MLQAQEQVTTALSAPEVEVPNLIVVTGFGPFEGHTDKNASWEAVKLLPDELEHAGVTYKLLKEWVPVEYAAVDAAVEKIWAKKPTLVVHCGVNGVAECIQVEKLAQNHAFKRPDYAGKCLPEPSVQLTNTKRNAIHSGLDVEGIVAAVKHACGCRPSWAPEASTQVAKISHNVGTYLCGYIYLKSLDHDRNRTLFVHVPPVDKPFSSQQTADVIYDIVEECMRQIVGGCKE